MQISFISENVQLPPLNREAVAEWIEAVAATHGKRVGALTYIFCDDPYILRTNREFLQHDYFTDIITFDYTKPSRIAGDMVISLDTVRTNAALFGKAYESELLRVVIHGVLHLCGINDKGPGEREIMEEFENKALAIVPPNIYNV